MAEFYYDDLARNLPDSYKKDKSSNNYRILEIERTANGELRTLLSSVENIMNIDNATGATLDMFGAIYGQARGKATDAQYRIMIKSKILRSLCNGTYKNIVDSICATFNCTAEEVLIVETGEPMSVRLEKTPLSAIIKAGFSSAQAEQIVKRLLPVGTVLESVLFEGTFEFSETENEYDETKGFGETVDSEIGGYLGWTSSQESVDTLPI